MTGKQLTLPVAVLLILQMTERENKCQERKLAAQHEKCWRTLAGSCLALLLLQSSWEGILPSGDSGLTSCRKTTHLYATETFPNTFNICNTGGEVISLSLVLINMSFLTAEIKPPGKNMFVFNELLKPDHMRKSTFLFDRLEINVTSCTAANKHTEWRSNR